MKKQGFYRKHNNTILNLEELVRWLNRYFHNSCKEGMVLVCRNFGGC